MSEPLSFDLFLFVGGYWSSDGLYHGGEGEKVGTLCSETFSLSSVSMYVKDIYVYEENMKTPDKREDIDDDDTLRKVIHYALGSGAMTLYVVREDDPYIGRHLGSNDGNLDDIDHDSNSESDVADVVAEGEHGDTVIVANEEQIESSSESDVADALVVLDDSKYRNFRLGQEYQSLESFKSAITRYVVRKRRDIKYDKPDSKRVVAICSDKTCPWRSSATINSSSIRAFVRSFKDEHNCTWQRKISLLTNACIANIYLEEYAAVDAPQTPFLSYYRFA